MLLITLAFANEPLEEAVAAAPVEPTVAPTVEGGRVAPEGWTRLPGGKSPD